MSVRNRVAAAAIIAASATAGTAATAQAADTIYGLTSTGLTTFSSSAPGAAATPRTITGLVGGDSPIGIDIRPQTGQLYLLARDATDEAAVYTVDPVTAAATLLTSARFTLTGTEVGFDFNPTVNAIRVVSDADENLRVSAASGNLAAQDTALAYEAGDPQVGTNPAIGGAAYTNSTPNSATTVLYDLDTGLDQIVVQTVPNSGILRTDAGGGPFGGPNLGAKVGFDIATDGTAYVSGTNGAAVDPSLYTANLTTGALTLVGRIGPAAASPVVDIAVAQPSVTLLALRGTPQALVTVRPDRGVVSAPTPVTGLNTGETLLGIDTRPSNGTVVGVTSSNRVVTVDPGTGAVATIGTLGMGNLLTSGDIASGVAVDVNPVPDALRIVTGTDKNLRFVFSSGAVFADTAINPNGADVSAAAYTNSFAGATATQLFDIDLVANQLNLQDPPGNGTLTTAGNPLGVDATTETAYDIAQPLNAGFAAIRPGGAGNSFLYGLNHAGPAMTPANSPQGVALRISDLGGSVSGLTALPVNRTAFVASTASVRESDGTVTIAVSRSTSEGPASVEVTASPGTAAATNDFAATNAQVVSFADGETLKTFTIAIAEDTVDEVDETFTVTLGNPQGTTLSSPSTTTVTIRDNDVGTRRAPSELVYGLVSGGLGVVTFDSSRPGAASAPLTITGLPAGEVLESIDVRPATGQLFGLAVDTAGTAARIVRIDTVTGAATVIGSAPIAVPNQELSIDFNPTVDRIRVSGSGGFNARLNPNTGTRADAGMTPNDGSLFFPTADANGGETPVAAGAAYTNSVPGNAIGTSPAPTTGLYVLEAGNDVLALQEPPNAGGLNTIGGFGGPDLGAIAGFDISAAGTALAVATPAGTGALPTLYEVNLDTGVLVNAGRVGPASGTPAVVDLAIGQPIATFVGLTDEATQRLFTFRADRPGASSTPVAVTGLNGGERIVGIDTRPATGDLTAVTSANRVLDLDLATGAATTPRTLSTALVGTDFGVDFNPVPDRLRIVSSTVQNLRVNPADGAATVDGPLAYDVGEPAPPSAPAIAAAGYTNSLPGASSTQLFNIDAANDRLVLQDPPNNGTLKTVGGLGLDVTNKAALDIVPGLNTQFAALQIGAAGSRFYAVNGAGVAAQRGQAVVAGDFSSLPAGTVVTGLAALPADRAEFSVAAINAGEGSGSVTLAVTRTGDGGRATVTVASADGTATAGSDYTSIPGGTVVTFEPGETVKTITVPIAGDTADEADETFGVALAAPTGGVVLGSPRTTTVTIADDDPATVTGPTTTVTGPTQTVTIPGQAPPPAADRTAPTAFVIGLDTTLARLRSSGARIVFGANEVSTLRGRLQLGSRALSRTISKRITSTSSNGRLTIKLTTAGKKRVAGKTSRSIRFVGTVTDAAGNVRRVSDTFRASR